MSVDYVLLSEVEIQARKDERASYRSVRVTTENDSYVGRQGKHWPQVCLKSECHGGDGT